MLELHNEETILVESIKKYLSEQSAEECEMVNEKFQALHEFGTIVSRWPPVRGSQQLRGVQRDEEHLIQALCSFASPSHLLHTPVRVVATRSYLVAKFHAFSFLHILTKDNPEFAKPLRNVVFSIMHSLMAEEVYFSCLNEPDFSQEVKISLANDLVALWEKGSDPRAVQHLPALDSLWTARDASPPCFGTMNASSELLRLTMDMDEDWQEFLVAHVSINETRWAIEEFLLGLSHEEINSVRSRLAKFGINAVGHNEIHSYLGGKPAYAVINSSDYRSIYDFYVERRDAARFRQRLSIPGPVCTLEEIYIKYRISQE